MACKISPTGEDRNEPVWPAGGWFCVNAPPNGSRLNCGAEHELSRIKTYETSPLSGNQCQWGRAPTASSAC